MFKVDQDPSSSKTVNQLLRWRAVGEPLVISINGEDNVPVSDDKSFRMLVALVDRLELLEVLKRATNDLDDGKGLGLEDVKEQAWAKFGISL